MNVRALRLLSMAARWCDLLNTNRLWGVPDRFATCRLPRTLIQGHGDQRRTQVHPEGEQDQQGGWREAHKRPLLLSFLQCRLRALLLPLPHTRRHQPTLSCSPPARRAPPAPEPPHCPLLLFAFQAGVELQQRLPNARVLHVSAS